MHTDTSDQTRQLIAELHAVMERYEQHVGSVHAQYIGDQLRMTMTLEEIGARLSRIERRLGVQ